LASLLASGKWSKVPLACERLDPLARLLARPVGIANHLLFVASLLLVALLALQVRSRYLQTYEVIGTSMLPSLTPGEVLAGGIASFGPGRLPHRGEVVVLQAMVDGVPREVIKRVLGLPGDRVQMNGVHPIINGWQVPLCEVGAYFSPNDETARSGDPSGLLVMEFLEGQAYVTLQSALAPPVPEYTVKPDEVFVLGDNRSNSRDSRTLDRSGPRGVPLKDIKAKAARVLFRPTPRGDVELASAFTPLGPNVFLDGADLSATRGRITGCLALRPKTTTPPRALSAALAFHE
jgi:signal peptidase I